MFCGIDVGTQGVRAVVIDADGALLGTGTAPLPVGRRTGREHEQDPAEWWLALAAAVRSATASARAATGDDPAIASLALDATSGTVLVETADGAASGPALMYDDARAIEQAHRAQDVGAGLWRELGYRMQPGWALPKAMWLLEHVEMARGARIVHQSDHLVRRLVGAPVATDVSNALKTGADLRDATWPLAIQGELGISPGQLPELVLPGAELGRVSAAAAAETGLPEGVVVRAGMTDGCAAQIAAGALAQGSWSSALGTTLVIKGSTPDLVRDPGGAVYCHRHPDGGWLPGGASSTGAGILRSAFAEADAAGLAAITERARSLVPDKRVAYPLDGRGERFPFLAADAHGFGVDGSDEAQRFASICQGIAYIERLAYDVLRHLGADTTGTVALTGGTAANVWWNQLRTDVLGRPTVVPASAEAAFGMAVLAAAPAGRLTHTAESMVRISGRYEPDAERSAAFRPGYQSLVSELAQRGWLDTQVADAVLAETVMS